MIGANVHFDYNGDFDRARITKVAENTRAVIESTPGVRFKFYTLDEKNQRATNFYVWDSQDAAERFFSEETRALVTDLYGVAPTIDYVEIAEIVDNS
jgi:Putative mono-oxygenase ydhR